MMINIGQAVYMTDEEFATEVAERKAMLDLEPGEEVLGCPLCSFDEFPQFRSRTTDNDNN